MATVKHHKVVATLPSELEANSIYYVRAGQGHDVYVTNGSGMIVGYPANAALGLAGKVDKVAGQSLITDAERTKLGGIATGAQVNVATNLAQGTRTSTGIPLTSSTGTGTTLPVATTSLAGLQSATDKSKLDGIAAGAQVNVATNLAQGTRTSTGLPLTSSTGTGTTLPVATTTLAGLQSAADKAKLDGISAGAQVNTVTSVAGRTGAVTLAAADVGLGSADNTSDANKPVSTAQQAALDGKVDKVSGKGLSSEDFTTALLNKLNGLAAELNPSGLPTIRPSLRLDFLNYGDRLDPRITFTRSTGGGRFNAQGQYEWLPANTPRIDYDPVTGECRGLLIEEQRTNLLTHSSDFANAAWSTASSSLSFEVPGGPVTVTANNANDYHGLRRVVTAGSIGQPITLSARVRAGSTPYIGLSLVNGSRIVQAAWDISTKNIIRENSVGTGVIIGSGIKDIGDGEFIIWVSGYFTDNNYYDSRITMVTAGGGFVWAGDGSSSIKVVWSQLEVGSFPTSYIPTTTAQVTRAADIASVNELSPWYNPEQGTLFVEYIQGLSPLSAANRVLELYAGNPADQSALRVYEYTDGGRAVLSMDGLDATLAMTPVAGYLTKHKTATTYTTGTISASRDGSVAKSAAHEGLPLFSNLRIGARENGTQTLNGYIRSIRYFPRRLSDTELQAITQ